MSQDVLRFMFVSPPRKPPNSLQLSLELSGIGSTLFALSQGEDGPARVTDFARSFLDGSGFAGDPSKLPMSPMFRALADRLSTQNQFTTEFLRESIDSVVGAPASEIAASSEFRTHVQKLADGILALTVVPAARPSLLEEYVPLFRIADLISKVAESPRTLDGLPYKTWSRTPLELPPGLFPLKGRPPTASAEEPGETDITAKTLTTLNAKLIALDDASEELLAIGADDLRIEEDVPADSDNARALLAVSTRVGNLERLVRDLAAKRPDDTSPSDDTSPADTAPAPPSLLASTPGRSRLLLKPVTVDRLTPTTKATFAELEVDLEHTALASLIDRLELESERVRRDVERLTTGPEGPATVRVGNTIVPTSLFASPAAPVAADDFTAPDSDGNLSQFGIGSLLVTSVQIERYEAGEIAHIENVLIGETKERETRRLRRTEETTVREVETTKEEERDLQSAERLEMQREVQNTVKESQQFHIGGSISAAYGPFVQATVTTEFATDSSSEDVARNASNYAREIVERTASKITERIREEQTIRVIQEFEERNLHRLDGSGRDQHIIGIFQWVDKVYQAQVYDYGARLIRRLYVPEPARFLQQAVHQSQSEQEDSNSPPDPINFGPLGITPGNYGAKVKKYRAKGVSPPPEAIVTLSATFKKQEAAPAAEGEEGEEEDTAEKQTTFTETRDQTIPNGYRAIEAYVTASSIESDPTKGGIPYGVVLHVGRRVFPFVHPDTPGSVIKGELTHPLDNEVGSLPIGLVAENVTQYVAGVEIKCHRTTTALRKWQLQTYEAILEAYQAQEAEYRERLAETAAQEGIVIEGRNPEQNRQIERTELKRLALSMITRQHFGGFGAYKSTVPVPHIDFDKAFEQSKFIRFCTEAFEWDNMSFELEDYFWTNKNRWAKKLLPADTDPLHAAFHAAGAAKVEIPLRPDYEAAFLYYLNTGKIWEGGALPPVITSAQSALLAQILERREGEDPHQRIPVGEPWEVRLPTTLVRVSPSAALPRWEQDENGDWHPVEQE